MILRPDFLKKNDKIGMVAPSFGCTFTPYLERLNSAIQSLIKEGYKIYLGNNVYKAEGIAASNSPEKRAKELMDMWKSDVKLIMSVGGGETMGEILPYIDFDYIKENPKWFLGYSDNTNLIYPLTTITDMEAIYGVHAPQFHTRPFKYDVLDTINMLKGKLSFNGYKSFEYHEYKALPEGEEPKKIDPFEPRHLNKRTKVDARGYIKPIKGRLIGGCLDCLQTLCGTKFDHTKEYIYRHKDEGIIFFLEACDLSSIGVRRALVQLKNAGWFSNVSMIITGRSYHLNDKSFGLPIAEAYFNTLKDLNIPVLVNCPFGHIGPTMPIRSGALAKVSYINNNIKIEYEE